MLRGIYTSASGMKVQTHHMDAIANNLANVDQTGYKQDFTIQKAYGQLQVRRTNDDGVHHLPIGSVDHAPIIGKLTLGAEYNETFTQFTQGPLKETGSAFDLAIEGRGFFSIETPQGERYTRNGVFLIDNNGLLVTKDGFPVLGQNGRVYLKKNNFIVNRLGQIYQNPKFADDPRRLVDPNEHGFEESELVDSLKIVDFDRDVPRQRLIKKVGNSFWMATDASRPPQILAMDSENSVRQGFVEASNVNIVNSMVRMIEVNRAYEANQKVIQAADTSAGQLINRAMTT